MRRNWNSGSKALFSVQRLVQAHGDADADAHDGSEDIALGHPAQAGQGLPEQTLVEAAPVVEGIEHQFTGAFLGEQAQGTGQAGESEAGAELPGQQKSEDAEQGRQDEFAVALPPEQGA